MSEKRLITYEGKTLGVKEWARYLGKTTITIRRWLRVWGKPCPPPRKLKGRKSYDPTRSAWNAMISRCTRPHIVGYQDYGGRGITVHPAWIASYSSFLEDVGPRPGKEFSLDRIDNNGNYEPGNVRWATRTEQNRNTRANHKVTYQGETLTVAAWAEKLGLSPTRIYQRLSAGYDLDRVFSPSKRKPRNSITKTTKPEYNAWNAMTQHCTNPKHPAYRLYGAKGITVCDPWLKDFQTFLNDMGRRPSNKHSLGRIDLNLGYFPGNCRWATKEIQNYHRTTTKRIVVNGVILTMKEAASTLGISYEAVRSRVRKGMYPTPG